MKETIEQIATHRTDFLKKLFSVPRMMDEEDSRMHGMDQEELIVDEGEKMRRVPGLTHLGIPLTKTSFGSWLES